MNVVFILPSLRQGGSEKVFSSIVKKWRRHECKLIVLEKVTNDQINRYEIPESKVVSLNKKRSITAIYSLYKELKKLNAKVVISTFTHVNIIILFLSFFYRAKYIIRESSVFSVMSKFDKKKWIIEKLLKKLYAKSDKIICQSIDIKKDLERILDVQDNQLLVINNPIDISKIPLSGSDPNESILKMVYVARFGPEKGHLRLIDILRKIKRPFILELLGNGLLLEDCKEKVMDYNLNNKVLFRGQISPPYKTVRNCDLYIQPSYVEGFPNALLEACAIGLPAIAYNVPGGTKEIINENNGLLVEDGNAKEFAKAINDFSESKYDAGWIRNDIKNRYSLDQIIVQYEGLVNNNRQEI